MPTTAKNELDPFSDEALEARPVANPNAVQSGWEAASTITTQAAPLTKKTYVDDFKFKDGEYQIVKFLDQNGPFAVYKQHFLQQKTEGKRSYISLGANDPLTTRLGSKPEEKRAFSIVNFSLPEGPQRQKLIATPRLWKSLHAAHFSPQGPLIKNYWALTRTGIKQTTAYNIVPVKGRDLVDDWNIPFSEQEADALVATFAPFTKDDVKIPTWEELEEVARSLGN